MTIEIKLTPKQEAFCLKYLELGNASEAYRQVYSCAKMKIETVHRKAAELVANGKVTARMAQLQGKAADAAVLNRAWVLNRVMQVVRIALNEEEPAAKTKTVKTKTIRKDAGAGESPVKVRIEGQQYDFPTALRGLEMLGKTKEAPCFTERHEHMGAGGGPIDVREAPRKTIANKLNEMANRMKEYEPANENVANAG